MDAKTMSDNSRRTVCRLVFLLLCALPLTLVVYRICHPVSISQWQQAIKANLGLSTKIGSVETPLPFVTLFHDVQLIDPELKQFVHLDELEVITGMTNQITVSQAIQIDASALAIIAKRLRETLMRTQSASQAWTITLNHATFNQPGNRLDSGLVLSPVQISVHPYPTVTTANITMSRVDDPQNPISISLRHDREESHAIKETFSLETGEAFLPCWIAHDMIPELKSFGPLCEFNGFAEFVKDGNRWSGQLPLGQFQHLDLKELTLPYGQKVEGLCGVGINNCIINDGKIESVEVALDCPQGSIDYVTGMAAKHYLNIDWHGEQTDYEFQDLRLNFQVSDGNFRLDAPHSNRIVAKTRSGPLMSLQASSKHHLKELAAFLGSQHTRNVNDSTIGFLGRFRMPMIRFAEDTNVPPPNLR